MTVSRTAVSCRFLGASQTVYNSAVARASADMLKKVPLFAGLDDRELGQIAASMKERRFAAGDSIDYMLEADPAPGRLELVRRFVNTVDHEHGREVLHAPPRLRALLVELGLLDPAARVTARDLGCALELRETLRELALANNG